MLTFSTVTPPERIDKRMFPMSTLRFNALFNEDSISGRKRLASITNGSRITTSNRTTTIPPALAIGNYEIRTHAAVTRINVSGNRATGVTYVDSGTLAQAVLDRKPV